MKQVLSFVAVAMLLVSCGKSENLYDSTARESNVKQSYADNFTKTYGTFPNQTWDFTKGARLGTRGTGSITAELIDGLDFGITDGKTIHKNKPIFDAIQQVLPERKEHKGQPAVLVTPSSSFYIFPVTTQGRWLHKLKIRVGDEIVQLYDKTWDEWRTPYVNGMKANNSNEILNLKGVKIQAPVGTPVQVYLDEQKSYGNPRSSVGTMNGQAIYVDVPSDVQLDLSSNGIKLQKDAIIKYIGIEDIPVGGEEGEKSDKDFNDVVLAVVGNPDVPEEVIVTEDSYEVSTNTTKRYMIEDLGSTNDFDFNDVVVDVIENITVGHKITMENGVVVKDEETGTVAASQRAIIRALGGTLDLKLKIGDTEWTKSSKLDAAKMYNTQGDIDYNAVLDEFPVSGWSPSSNNISIVVNQKESGEVFTITFPKKGAAPMIIAVEPELKWMSERVSVPKAWFYTAEQK